LPCWTAEPVSFSFGEFGSPLVQQKKRESLAKEKTYYHNHTYMVNRCSIVIDPIIPSVYFTIFSALLQVFTIMLTILQ